MINYVIGNEKSRERIAKITVDSKVESNHHLLVWIKSKKVKKEGKETRKEEGKGGNLTNYLKEG